MRLTRLLPLLLTAALVLGGCSGRGPLYAQYQYAPPPQAAMPSVPVPAVHAAPPSAPTYQAPAQAPAPRGLLSQGGPSVRVASYRRPAAVAPCGPQGCGAASAHAAYPQPFLEQPYLLDAGDRLRITVFGQDGLTNSYAVDAAGNITMPLVGTVPARGLTTQQLSYVLTERLKQGYIREPKVAIEVEAYRPFFIHGEVATPGQFAYVANMTVENAIAIAGGFGPRADRSKVTLSRTINGATSRANVGLNFPLRPGDTLRVGERWF
jgi:polysaccharide export outer membrane protein